MQFILGPLSCGLAGGGLDMGIASYRVGRRRAEGIRWEVGYAFVWKKAPIFK